jgi:hypothetical protein
MFNNKERDKMIRYIAVQHDTPDVPRAFGEGDTHEEALLQCEIAIREKYLGKLSRGYNGPLNIERMYKIKEEWKPIKLERI